MRYFGLFLLLLGLTPTLAAQQPRLVDVKVEKNYLEYSVGGKMLAQYHHTGYAKPILWPVKLPSGVDLTRSWPMLTSVEGETRDHPHQKSVWFCHGDVIPEGIELKQKIKGVEGVDFWSEAPGHGKIVCEDIQVSKIGGNRVLSSNEWRTADGMKIMDEKRRIQAHELKADEAYLFIFDITLKATVCPITFGDTKEGCFGIRINDRISESKKGTGQMQNAEGKKTEKETWGKQSAWVDYSGEIDGKKVGLAVFQDPKNLPACWHARGYGLLAVNPFGREKSRFTGVKAGTPLVRLAKGEELHLRYGLLLHTGDTVSGRVAEHYKHFVEVR